MSKSTDPAELRRCAEQRVREKIGYTNTAPNGDAVPKLLHELQVHQIELEMQNEELRQTRAEAETALQHYSELYDFAPSGYFTLEHGNVICNANLAAAKILKIERAKLIGRRLGTFVAARSLPVFNTFMENLSGGQAKTTCEVELIDTDGAAVFVLIEAAASKAENAYYLVAVDITERKLAEQNLLTLYTAIEQSPISVVIADADANILYVNPHFTTITGYTAEEVIGQNPRLLQSGQTPKETYQELWDKIGSGQIWHGEFINKRKNGELYWEEAHIAPVTDEAGGIVHYVCLKIDISQRKKSEQAGAEMLRQNRALTRRMFTMQEENLRKISLELHDELGQWLTAIQAEAYAIDHVAGSASAIQASAHAISRSAEAMHEVIHRMVHSLRPSLLDALGLAEALRELEKQWCQPRLGIACDFVLAGDLEGLSNELKITLFRLVQEALNNIANYAQASHVSVQLQRMAGASTDAGLISLDIADDGVGFDPDQHTEGTGLLGMRERVVAAGGEFDLRSEPGRGTRIHIELPLENPGGGEP